MFKEIAQMLGKGQSVSLSVNRLDEQNLRVIISPVIGEQQPDKETLRQPLSVDGTPEDLDASLGPELLAINTLRQEALNTGAELKQALADEAAANRAETAKVRGRTRAKKETPEQQVEREQAAAKTARTGEQLDLTTAAAPAVAA